MLNAETIYRKARQLDTLRLQEVSDFIDFIISKTQDAESLNKLPAGLAEKTGTFWQPQPFGMSVVLVDTDVVSYLFKKDSRAARYAEMRNKVFRRTPCKSW